MLTEFDHRETEDFFDGYYEAQVGEGLAVFNGKPIMDGDGFGSFLGSLLKKAAPMLKTVAKSAAKTVGRNALGVVSDIAAGKNFKEAAMGGLRNVGGEVLGDVFEAVSAGGRQRGNTTTTRSRKTTKRKRKSGGVKRVKKQRTVFD